MFVTPASNTPDYRLRSRYFTMLSFAIVTGTNFQYASTKLASMFLVRVFCVLNTRVTGQIVKKNKEHASVRHSS